MRMNRVGVRVLISLVIILGGMSVAVASERVPPTSRPRAYKVLPLIGGDWFDNFLPERLSSSERVQNDAGKGELARPDWP